MAETYPAINDLLQRASFSYTVGENVIRSEIQTGPVKVRRISTKRIDNFAGNVRFDQDELDTFLTFYNITLGDGVLSFNFPDPIDLPNLVEVRFSAVPNFNSVGFEAYDVNFTLERIN